MVKHFADRLSDKVIGELEESLFYLSFVSIRVHENEISFSNPFMLGCHDLSNISIKFKPNIEYVENLNNREISSIIKDIIKLFKSIEKKVDKSLKPIQKDLHLYYYPYITKQLGEIEDYEGKYNFINQILSDKELEIKVRRFIDLFTTNFFSILEDNDEISVNTTLHIEDYYNHQLYYMFLNYFTILLLVQNRNSLTYLKIQGLFFPRDIEYIQSLRDTIRYRYDEITNYKLANINNSKLDNKNDEDSKSVNSSQNEISRKDSLEIAASKSEKSEWTSKDMTAKSIGTLFLLLRNNELIEPSLSAYILGIIGQVLFNKNNRNIDELLQENQIEKCEGGYDENHLKKVQIFLKKILKITENELK